MKKNRITSRLQAAVLSAMIAAVSVPAIMTTAPIYAEDETAVTDTVALTEVEKGYESGKMSLPEEYSASNPIKTISLIFEAERACSISYGFGITTSTGWKEHNSKGGWDTKGGGFSVDLKKGTNKVDIDISGLKLKYDEYTEFEFRLYHCAYWDNAEKDNVQISVMMSDFIYNDDSVIIPNEPDDPDTPDDPDRENVVPDNNKHSNGKNSDGGKNWSFVDNKDGTATISATVAKQIDDEALGNIVLTKGYDEEYYAANPNDDENRPMNSHKFRFSDFGLTDMDGVIIESITCVVESESEMDQFVYGGGINVKEGSPADTEYAKQIAGIKGKEHAGYWYNDMGAEGEGSVSEFEEAGVEFQITPGNGGKLFGAGSYFEAYWEVPAEVQPHVSDYSTDSISFQYWWGNDVDGEEVESVNITNAVLTYTKTVTVPYTDSVITAVDKTISHLGKDDVKNFEVSYKDLGIDETKDVYAIRFDVTADSDIGKLIYNVGTGVTEDVNPDYWFQEAGNYCMLEAGSSAELMYIMPKKVAGDEEHANGVNTKDGKVLIGYYYGEADAITINNIEVYYANEPTTTTTTTTTAKPTVTTTTTTAKTTTTTKATTTATKATTTTTKAATTTTKATTTTTQPETTTTTAPPPKATLWGDANCDGKVEIADATLILQYLTNKDEYTLSEIGMLNADCCNNGDGVTALDALAIQKFDAGIFKHSDFPVKE